MSKKVAVYRKEHFNAAHRLYRADWDDAQNFSVFGKCSYPHYHGHNYELEVKVLGEPDPVTGFVIDMKQLSDLAKFPFMTKTDLRDNYPFGLFAVPRTQIALGVLYVNSLRT